MDSMIMKRGYDYARKRKRLIGLIAAAGVSGYGLYTVYHLPSVAKKRRKLVSLLRAVVSVAGAVSESAESIRIVSKDLNEFLKSNSDEIPNSLKQLSKIAKSSEFSDSVVGASQALTLGVLQGYSQFGESSDAGDSNMVDKVLDKVFTPAGTGFASVVVGSFARNMVMSIFSNVTRLNSDCSPSSELPEWTKVLYDEKTKGLIGDCIQMFVSTAVAVYLDKTMDMNVFDDVFSGMTNPKHDTKVREVLAFVCKNAVEALVRTSHHVLTTPSGNTTPQKSKSCDDSDSLYLSINEMKHKGGKFDYSYHDMKNSNGWVTKVSSTLAVPSNRKLVLDLSGRMTSESVRSVMEFLMEKVCDGMVKSANHVQESVVDSGREAVRYVSAKSSVMTTLAISVCLHIVESAWILAPPPECL